MEVFSRAPPQELYRFGHSRLHCFWVAQRLRTALLERLEVSKHLFLKCQHILHHLPHSFIYHFQFPRGEYRSWTPLFLLHILHGLEVASSFALALALVMIGISSHEGIFQVRVFFTFNNISLQKSSNPYPPIFELYQIGLFSIVAFKLDL